ncbi:MAG: hypothetical protein AAF580_03480 [Pseudomonadota bacterium]
MRRLPKYAVAMILVLPSIAAADTFEVTMPALVANAGGNVFEVTMPPLVANAGGNVFEVTMPTLVANTGGNVFEVTMPSLVANAGGNVFEVTMPPLVANAGGNVFEVTMPTLVAKAGGNVFEVTMPPLVADVGGNVFEVTMPPLLANGEGDVNELEPLEQLAQANDSVSANPCGNLNSCYPPQDIAQGVAEMSAIGMDPSDPQICLAVQMALGPCTVGRTPSGGGSGGSDSSSSDGGFPFDTDDDLEVNAVRCPPLERYQLDLRRRFNAGEDTDAEETILENAMYRSLPFVMRGDMMGWCKSVMGIINES